MREDLNHLWDDYLIEAPLKSTKEDMPIKERFSAIERKFRSNLDAEQIALLEEYDSAVSALGRVSERNAFTKGVMFTARFIFQALYGD